MMNLKQFLKRMAVRLYLIPDHEGIKKKCMEFEAETREEMRRISDDDPENPPEVRKI